ASLQYGPQFGGLLNYRIKKGNPTKKISFETQQTLGSFGLFSTYNALGGTHKKFSYYGFLHHRSADGWRNNSQYFINSGYFSVNYQVTKKFALSGEYTSMNYKSQQAGGLSDAQYNENHQQSFRSRNWFGAPYNVASLTLTYAISKEINVEIKSFFSFAERNSVGFTSSIITKDSINPGTLEYNNRQVDRDKYKNYGTEARMSVKYKFFGKENIFAGGVRAYHGGTIRNQKGVGTNGSDFDLSLTNPLYGRSLEFSTTNLAVFSENIFQLGKRLKIVPGLRFEYIDNTRKGYIDASGTLPKLKKERTLFLYGLGGEFKVSETINLYGNYSLAYRPVTFSELSPSATTETIDPNLKDASGFNADCGFRGTLKNYLSFDVGLFYLNYDNRIGSIIQNGTTYKTNIGTSVSKG
ncbi:MAG: TonB-dependent receptor, partial [Flavobacteriales bacterium]|nr:TonB-dependent receptor [Flavobacteriales bacterium]